MSVAADRVAAKAGKLLRERDVDFPVVAIESLCVFWLVVKGHERHHLIGLLGSAGAHSL